MATDQNPREAVTAGRVLWKKQNGLPLTDREQRLLDLFEQAKSDIRHSQRTRSGNLKSRLRAARRHVDAALSEIGDDPADGPTVEQIRLHLQNAQELLERSTPAAQRIAERPPAAENAAPAENGSHTDNRCHRNYTIHHAGPLGTRATACGMTMTATTRAVFTDDALRVAGRLGQACHECYLKVFTRSTE